MVTPTEIAQTARLATARSTSFTAKAELQTSVAPTRLDSARPIDDMLSRTLDAATAEAVATLAMRAGATADLDRAMIVALRTGIDPSRPIGPAWLQEAGRDVTALGSYTVIVFPGRGAGRIPVASRRSCLRGPADGSGGMAVSTMLKIAVDRPRPEVPHAARVFTASFPSGHATLSSITYLTLAALLARSELDRRIRIYVVGLAVLLTASIGFSRLYLGLHYPDDVIAGWLTGAACALSCWMIALRLNG